MVYYKSLAVYHGPSDFEMFSEDKLADRGVSVRLSINEIFSINPHLSLAGYDGKKILKDIDSGLLEYFYAVS